MSHLSDLPPPARNLFDLGIWRMARAGSKRVFEISEKFPDIELECEQQGTAYCIRQNAILVLFHLCRAWSLRHPRKQSLFHVRKAAKAVFQTLMHLEYALDLGFIRESQIEKLRRMYLLLYVRLRCIAKRPKVWRKVFLGPDSAR